MHCADGIAQTYALAGRTTAQLAENSWSQKSVHGKAWSAGFRRLVKPRSRDAWKFFTAFCAGAAAGWPAATVVNAGLFFL